MSVIISLLNHKGGVGKTTSAINIGAALALMGKQVLLVDLDSQANLTLSLGVPRQKVTIYENMVLGTEITPYQVKEGLDVVPSSINFSAAETQLSGEVGAEFILRELFEPLEHEYDYIIIDCPPSLGLLTKNALTASDYVVIPLQPEFLASQGLLHIQQVINKVRLRLNKKLKIGGVLVTMYNNRIVLNQDILHQIEKYYKDKVFKTKIRSNISLAEAQSQQEDIFEYSAKSNGAMDYMALAKEILARVETVSA